MSPAIIVDMHRPDDPLGPDVIAEFEVLLARLDLRYIHRAEWDRLKVILVVATLEASDAEAGQQGYQRAVEKWRGSRWYDGHD